MALDIKELLVEGALTACFVCAVIASNGQPLVVGGALIVAICVGVYALGSAAVHLNPAVTLGFVSFGHVATQRGVWLILMQLLGGILGAGVVLCYKRFGPAKH
jgi:glycerol uptake facilitator-like aquaporin